MQPSSSSGSGATAHPQAADHQPQLTIQELKEVMKDAIRAMRRKVLLENGIPTTQEGLAMAEDALLEAAAHAITDVPLNIRQIQEHDVCIKTLRGVINTVRGVFKKEARRVVVNKYHLTPNINISDSTTDSEVEDILSVIGPLLQNRDYLFEDPNMLSPINHPAIVETIHSAIWITGTNLRDALDFEQDNLDNLLAIGSAAVHSSLLEYKSGSYKAVPFSSSWSGAEYKASQRHNDVVRDTPALRSASLSVRQHIVTR